LSKDSLSNLSTLITVMGGFIKIGVIHKD